MKTIDDFYEIVDTKKWKRNEVLIWINNNLNDDDIDTALDYLGWNESFSVDYNTDYIELEEGE